MRILVLGAGGVGAATAAIARRRGFFDRMVLADLDPARARAAVACAASAAERAAAALARSTSVSCLAVTRVAV